MVVMTRSAVSTLSEIAAMYKVHLRNLESVNDIGYRSEDGGALKMSLFMQNRMRHIVIARSHVTIAVAKTAPILVHRPL